MGCPVLTTQQQKNELGIAVRQQRRRLGLTLDDLAARVGASKPYLSLIENGLQPGMVSDEKLRRIAQALGLDADELLAKQYAAWVPRELWPKVGALMR